MKLLLSAIGLAMCYGLGGCAGSPDPLLHEAGEDLKRGVTGGGTLYLPEERNDPFIDGGR